MRAALVGVAIAVMALNVLPSKNSVWISFGVSFVAAKATSSARVAIATPRSVARIVILPSCPP